MTQNTSRIKIAVVGAHLSGQPLNFQLLEEDGVLLKTCKTQSIYRLYALTSGTIPKPGLIRQPDGEPGYGIEVEIWHLPPAGFGRFVNQIPSPLGIGTIVLDDGETVKGFICETFAIQGAEEISELGGWRSYLNKIHH
jgi:allophanate hydrolase